MRKGRLLRLARYLETTAQRLDTAGRRRGLDRFYMGWWRETRKKNCGFSGCAVGWAMQGKLFPGLKWDGNAPSYTEGRRYYRDWFAVREVFGLSHDHSYFLFTLSAYHNQHPEGPQPRDVAARIRQFVKEN